MAARRLEDQAALLERRLSALDAAHGDEARISAAREATLGQLKAMTSEINNQKFLLAPKAAADDEQEGLPRCRWGAVQEQAHSLLRGAAQHPFGQLNKFEPREPGPVQHHVQAQGGTEPAADAARRPPASRPTRL